MDNSQISTESTSQFNSHLLHVVKDVCSSIVGSAACVYTGQPFDTVKGEGHFLNEQIIYWNEYSFVHLMSRDVSAYAS